MYYHILLTERCNSECKYCYGKSMEEFDNGLNQKFKFDFTGPEESVVDIKKLKRFLLKDPDPVLVFYGGEPLLEIEKLMKIMDDINVKYRMQTNGKLLHKLPPKYVNRIKKILISIDGDKKRTDYNKGEGTYDTIIKNVRVLRSRGYKGELVARMTISQEFPDLFEQVVHLVNTRMFNSIHWQIDCGFFKFDYNKEKFTKFVNEYNKSMSRLIDYWMSNMENGEIVRLYPFLGLIESMLNKEKTLLRCGAGYAGYAITTDGKVVACPIMNCIEDFKAGDIVKTDPKELKKFSIGGNCLDCEVLDLCGGRCLYWNKTGLWPKEGDELICNTIKHMISELQKRLPKIEDLIKKGMISKKYFYYEKYFGPEIIP